MCKENTSVVSSYNLITMQKVVHQFSGLAYHFVKWYASGQMAYRLHRHWCSSVLSCMLLILLSCYFQFSFNLLLYPELLRLRRILVGADPVGVKGSGPHKTLVVGSSMARTFTKILLKEI